MKTLIIVLITIPLLAIRAELTLPEIWNKNLWMKKQKENPLKNVDACKKYFPIEKEISKDQYDSCSPGDGSIIIRDKKNNKELATIHISNWCNGAEIYKYYLTEQRGDQNKISRDEFCEKITKVNVDCQGCLD